MLQAIRPGMTRALRRSLFVGASGLAVALSLGVGAAAAQTAAQSAPQQDEATEIDEVVVTGFRASLNASLDAKRRDANVIDVITAEDIGDFPDLNLAESIQRVPGVAIDRDAGEGRSITVRGLGSDFTRTRINGMEAQATAGGTDSSGGANRGRGFDFNVFASELFNSITVRKTAAAETEEGSLGATVDLQASRPFDYKDGFTGAFSAQGGWNDLSEQYNPRMALLLSNTFGANDEFGALISVAYSERDLLEEGFSSVRWAPAVGTNSSGGFASAGSNATAFALANQNSVFIPRLPRYGRLTHEQERLGITGALQWRPATSTVLSLDVLYSSLDATRQEDFLQALSFSRNAAAGGQPQVTVQDAVVQDNMLVYGLFNNVDIRSESRFDVLSTDYLQVSLTAEHDFSDRLRGRFYYGRAESNFENPIQTTVTLDRNNTQGYSFDFRGDSNAPVINYGFDVTNPANWEWRASTAAVPRSEIRIRPNGVDTLFDSAQADFEYDATDWLTVKAGVNWKTYSSESYEFRRADETVVPVLPAGTTVADISNLLTGFGGGLISGSTPSNWVRPDLNAIASLFNIYCNCNTGVPGGDFTLTSITNGNARGGNRIIEEEDLAFYLQADWDTDLFGRPFRGNVGVRQVNTQLNATGYSSTGGGTLVTGENEYDNTLPSLNISYEPVDDLIVRFGVASVMARPQIGNTLAGTNYLVPTTSLAASGPNYTASIGNVKLQPFEATTYDFSVEWYFAPESLLSFAYFYKDIDTYIQIVRQDLAYSDLTALNPSAFAPGFCTGTCSPSTIFQLTAAVNTEGGPLKGFEVSYQQPFTFLPGPLQNLGVQLNYTHVESEIDYCSNALCTTFVTADLINLSPESWNATLYYEDDRFSARVSGAFRDGYIQNVPGRNGNSIEGKMETFNLDASASYNLTDDLELTLEALNLTDEENHQFVGDGADRQSTSVYHHTGRQFYLGARYRF
ncbi:TonB-dependent receptor [Brevundimonas sp. GCM10030266]|uniref:TonB-dependent receptor n=1 Tax=Brevundimonas sp. GCM10030266 TaxID=3273386 RepID=UPI00361FEAFB